MTEGGGGGTGGVIGPGRDKRIVEDELLLAGFNIK